MNLYEFYPIIDSALHSLNFESRADPTFSDKPYYANNLSSFRSAIHSLESVPLITYEVKVMHDLWIFKEDVDAKFITNSQYAIVTSSLYKLKIKLEIIKEIIESSEFFGKENILFIKLPNLDTFEDLAKTSGEFKKAIEIPIMDEAINGEVKILAGDQGSVILYVSVGTILAIKIVAAICWASYVLKRKRAEARIFEAHAKTLNLKNDALQILIDAQTQQLKNILESEAEAIANKHYSHNDPETIERLKLSINSVADLVERGAKILPMNTESEVQKLFPDGSNALIESTIKQLTQGA